MLDVLVRLGETGGIGEAGRAFADALAAEGARVMSSAAVERWQIPGYEHLLDRLLPNGEPGSLLVAIGWGALEDVHRRAGLPFVVYIPWFARGVHSGAKRRLRRAAEVWTSLPVSEQLTTDLTKGDGTRLRVVPFVHNPSSWACLDVHRPEPPVIYTVGPWEDTLPVVEAWAALGAAAPRLLVVSPDCPITNKNHVRQICENVGAPHPEGFPVFLKRQKAEYIDTRVIHLSGDAYVDVTRDPWHLAQAALARNPVIALEDMDLLSEPDGVPCQPPPDDFDRVVELELFETVPHAELVARLEDPVAAVAMPAQPKRTESEPEPEAAFEGPRELSLVLPHLDRGSAYLVPAVAAVRGELVDEVVVVDYGSRPDVVDEVRTTAILRGWTLVEVEAKARQAANDAAQANGWNLAHARNVGARAAYPGSGRREPSSPRFQGWLLFLDSDVLLPPEWSVDAAEVMAAGDDLVLVPKVTQGTALAMGESTPKETGAVRGGTGLSMVPARLVWAVNGQDEAFTGWGYEDLDFLWRLRQLHDVETQTAKGVAYHQPHPGWEPVRGVTTDASEMEELYLKRIQGEPGPVNQGGWGRGGVVTVRRGEPTGELGEP
jgi:hypothetical protein